MSRPKYPSDSLSQFMVRLPVGMRVEIANAAKANGRSMNSEIIARLEGAPATSDAPLTAKHLAEAFHCFWNAAVADAHARESSNAMDCASVMASGFAAVAQRLEGGAR